MKIVVFGDVMLDVWSEGVVERISPEAPVPVLLNPQETKRPGGAANVAMNLKRLGVKEVVLASTFVDDEDGHLLRLMLKDAGVDCRVIQGGQWRTTRKHRLTCGGVQLLRVDHDGLHPAPTYSVDEVLSLVEGAEAVIVSDYDKGVVSRELCSILEDAEYDFYVDPKQAPETYTGATLVKPNAKEMRKLTWLDLDCPILHTAGSDDALYYGRGVMHDPTLRVSVEKVSIADVTGAGDAVLAALVVAECEGYSREEAIKIGIKAGTLCVQKHGTEGPTREELGLRPQYIAQKVVLTNGCFDLFHDGHRALLDGAVQEVKKLQDEGYPNTSLLVALNDDDSVRRLKGAGRPVRRLSDRVDDVSDYLAKTSKKLRYIITTFSEYTPLELIKKTKPDIIVKGSEYRTQRVVGELEALEWGGQVKFAPMVPGVSTTKIIEERGL